MAALATVLPAVAPVWANTAQACRLLVVGDSLSGEYGIARGSGWVAGLQARLTDYGYTCTVDNASISGDTTSGGLSRLPAALQRHAYDVVVLALGSNDALRGLSLDMTRDNLEKMLLQVKQAGAQPVLAGMHMPPNYGRAYSQAFNQLFSQLATQHHVGLIPFLLDGMATRPELFQADRLHPNEAAQAVILDNVWPVVSGLLPTTNRRE